MRNKFLIAPMALALFGCKSSVDYEQRLKEDLAFLKSTCEKYKAGDKIYRRVDGVKGLYRSVEGNPYPNWGDQFGLENPWIQGYIYPIGMYLNLGDPDGGRYWYLEAPPKFGEITRAPYRRNLLQKTDTKARPVDLVTSAPPFVSADGYLYESKVEEVNSLASEYAWSAEELTTKEMRAHWIAGGRIRITHRPTGELLAERVVFYRATGPIVKAAWAVGTVCGLPASGFSQSNYEAPLNAAQFVKYVLKPVVDAPTEAHLKQIRED